MSHVSVQLSSVWLYSAKSCDGPMKTDNIHIFTSSSFPAVTNELWTIILTLILSEWLNQAAALKVWLTADARCTLISSCLRAARLNCSDGGRRVVILWITSWKFTLKTAYLHIYSFIHLFMFFFFFCWKFHCFSSLSFSLNLLFLSC